MNSETTTDGATRGSWAAAICPLCERGPLTTRPCKTVCERCGYVESCEDNFPVRPDAKHDPQERV